MHNMDFALFTAVDFIVSPFKKVTLNCHKLTTEKLPLLSTRPPKYPARHFPSQSVASLGPCSRRLKIKGAGFMFEAGPFR